MAAEDTCDPAIVDDSMKESVPRHVLGSGARARIRCFCLCSSMGPCPEYFQYCFMMIADLFPLAFCSACAGGASVETAHLSCSKAIESERVSIAACWSGSLTELLS